MPVCFSFHVLLLLLICLSYPLHISPPPFFILFSLRTPNKNKIARTKPHQRSARVKPRLERKRYLLEQRSEREGGYDGSGREERVVEEGREHRRGRVRGGQGRKGGFRLHLFSSSLFFSFLLLSFLLSSFNPSLSYSSFRLSLLPLATLFKSPQKRRFLEILTWHPFLAVFIFILYVCVFVDFFFFYHHRRENDMEKKENV